MKRQRIRKTIIFISFLLFPITIWYFSPYLIIQAMSEHILNGSFQVFISMLILSVFFGRSWCGYLCPAGGLQECCTRINDKPARQGKRDRIKFVIWTIWILAVITTYILGKNDVTVDFFYMTDHGISVTEIYNYFIYYGVLLLFVLPALISGRRASCHYLCWMAPFMIIGSTIGRALHIPQLHIESRQENCASCKSCKSVCPMGLDVAAMVKTGKNAGCNECVECGACVDECPNKVLTYKFRWKGGK
jgi:polyferredoxin